jgi:hypothetical protein
MFGMLWIDSVLQFPPISSNFAQPLKRSGTTFHNQQPDQLCEDVLRCMKQIMDNDWFLIDALLFFMYL